MARPVLLGKLRAEGLAPSESKAKFSLKSYTSSGEMSRHMMKYVLKDAQTSEND